MKTHSPTHLLSVNALLLSFRFFLLLLLLLLTIVFVTTKQSIFTSRNRLDWPWHTAAQNLLFSLLSNSFKTNRSYDSGSKYVVAKHVAPNGICHIGFSHSVCAPVTLRPTPPRINQRHQPQQSQTFQIMPLFHGHRVIDGCHLTGFQQVRQVNAPGSFNNLYC